MHDFDPSAPGMNPDAPLMLRIEDLAVGMKANSERVITEADVALFAGLSGDHNPVHLDESYARETQFHGRIVHGMFSASLLSAVIANQLPGPGSIYLGQTLTFLAPVRIGDRVEAEVTVTDVKRDSMRVSLQTVCRVGNRSVLDGSALVLMQSSCSQQLTDRLEVIRADVAARHVSGSRDSYVRPAKGGAHPF
jgi:3-hydroxybutyryl-CoA dehydratase